MSWSYIFRQSLIFSIVFLFFSFSLNGQSGGRLESEYKISIPSSLENEVWNFLTDSFLIEIADSLKTSIAEEKFVDEYFDSEEQILLEHNAGLRFRRRFAEGELMKELVQLKLSNEGEDLVRNEIKYDKTDKTSFGDPYAQHKLLKHMKPNDRDGLAFHLAQFQLKPEEVQSQLKLIQKRKRIYFSDQDNISIATITFDHVTNYQFPFQTYVELEIELNEIRYTLADTVEKQKLDSLGTDFKSSILSRFNTLKIDQTPKYNKMTALISKSFLSQAYSSLPWIILSIIVLYAASLFR